MDINSIGSAPHFPGTSPVPGSVQGPGQPAVQGAVRENLAASGNAAPGRPLDPNAQNAQEQAKRQEVEGSVEALNDFLKLQETSLRFSIDDESGTVIVKVTDKETDEVIKQFPTEEAIELAKALDKLKGLLLHQEA